LPCVLLDGVERVWCAGAHSIEQ